MKIRTEKYSYLLTGISLLLMMNLLESGYAEYQNQHSEDIQMKNYEHPRFGDSWIRYCAFNQYLDDEEGRCMIVPGGGIAISIDDDTKCDPESLREDLSHPRNYYICRKTKTIIAECGSGKRFENRLKRCTIDRHSSIRDEEEDSDTEARSYEHVDVPACEKPGRFPVPQEDCTIFYSCTSNGFRLFRTFHKCPSSTGFDPSKGMCRSERACSNEAVEKTTERAASASTEGFYGMRTNTAEPSTRIHDSSVVSRTTTESYEGGEATIPFVSSKYFYSSDIPEKGNPLGETTVGMKDLSTEGMILPEEFTTSSPVSTERIYYNTIPDDYVKLKNNYQGGESTTESAVTLISNKEDSTTSIEATTQEATTFEMELQDSETTESINGNVSDKTTVDLSTTIVDTEVTTKSWTNEAAETTREMSTFGIEPQDFETTESVRQNVTEELFSATTVEDSPTTIVEEFTQESTTETWTNADVETTNEPTTVGNYLQDFETTEFTKQNVTDEWFSDTTVEDSSTTTFEEFPQETTTERWSDESSETSTAITFDSETTETPEQNVTDEWIFDTTDEDSSTTTFEEFPQETTTESWSEETSESPTEATSIFVNESQDSETTESPVTEEWLYKTPVEDSSTTIFEETSQIATTERAIYNPTSDEYKETLETTITETSWTDDLSTVTENLSTFTPEQKTTFSDDATSTTSINPSEVFESTTDSLISSETPQSEETTSELPDNSISTDQMESTMITTDSNISESTENPNFSETTWKDNSPADLSTSVPLIDESITVENTETVKDEQTENPDGESTTLETSEEQTTEISDSTDWTSTTSFYDKFWSDSAVSTTEETESASTREL